MNDLALRHDVCSLLTLDMTNRRLMEVEQLIDLQFNVPLRIMKSSLQRAAGDEEDAALLSVHAPTGGGRFTDPSVGIDGAQEGHHVSVDAALLYPVARVVAEVAGVAIEVNDQNETTLSPSTARTASVELCDFLEACIRGDARTVAKLALHPFVRVVFEPPTAATPTTEPSTTAEHTRTRKSPAPETNEAVPVAAAAAAPPSSSSWANVVRSLAGIGQPAGGVPPPLRRH